VRPDSGKAGGGVGLGPLKPRGLNWGGSGLQLGAAGAAFNVAAKVGGVIVRGGHGAGLSWSGC